MTKSINVDELLERFDQTDPALQRKIIARFAAESLFFRDALERINKSDAEECDMGDCGDCVACITQEALTTKFNVM